MGELDCDGGNWRWLVQFLIVTRRLNVSSKLTGDEASCTGQENQRGNLQVQCLVHKTIIIGICDLSGLVVWVFPASRKSIDCDNGADSGN
tara:strand:- start:12 stop:281 length:270 start_codon:yes stop_codon:yes gene_type:complete